MVLCAALMGTALTVSGCVGGTTYGTGVSQERQTIEDLSNMLSFRKKRTVIDYSARPDLVVPKNKQLVEPVDEAVTTSNAEWPESPEQRIARIRAEAEEATTSDAKRVAFDAKKKRFGGKFEKMDAANEAPIGQGIPNKTCDPDGVVMRKCTSQEISKAVQAQRKLASIGDGKVRRYLTEPPIEYRTPADTAPIGDEGYTEAELAQIEREKALAKREEELRNDDN